MFGDVFGYQWVPLLLPRRQTELEFKNRFNYNAHTPVTDTYSCKQGNNPSSTANVRDAVAYAPFLLLLPPLLAGDLVVNWVRSHSLPGSDRQNLECLNPVQFTADVPVVAGSSNVRSDVVLIRVNP
jgi:hypothetical protein